MTLPVRSTELKPVGSQECGCECECEKRSNGKTMHARKAPRRRRWCGGRAEEKNFTTNEGSRCVGDPLCSEMFSSTPRPAAALENTGYEARCESGARPLRSSGRRSSARSSGLMHRTANWNRSLIAANEPTRCYSSRAVMVRLACAGCRNRVGAFAQQSSPVHSPRYPRFGMIAPVGVESAARDNRASAPETRGPRDSVQLSKLRGRPHEQVHEAAWREAAADLQAVRPADHRAPHRDRPLRLARRHQPTRPPPKPVPPVSPPVPVPPVIAAQPAPKTLGSIGTGTLCTQPPTRHRPHQLHLADAPVVARSPHRLRPSRPRQKRTMSS